MELNDDSVLLELFRKEEKRNYAFNLLVHKYQERLYWHVRKMVIRHDDADDVVQNMWIKAWKGLETFRGESALFTWLFRIATNECITFMKQQKAKYLLSFTGYETVLANSLRGDAYFDGDETQRKLQVAILKLPEKQRLVFNMRYFEEMPYEQMSEILGTSEGALKASYHLAMKKIEKELKD